MATGSGSGSGPEPGVWIGGVHGSAVSVGGSNNTNTVHHGGTAAGAPDAAQLLDAVLTLREALVREAPGATTEPRSTPNWTGSPSSWRAPRRSGPACPPGCAQRWSGGLRWSSR